MKYYKKLDKQERNRNVIVGVIYRADEKPNESCYDLETFARNFPKDYVEVSLQDYAAQELDAGKLVKGGYYVNSNQVIHKHSGTPDAEYYINWKQGIFNRNRGNFNTIQENNFYRLATQEEIDWLEACNKADKFIPKLEMKKLDLNNFAIVVESNAGEILRFLHETKIYPAHYYNGDACNGSFYLMKNGQKNCVIPHSDKVKELTKYTLKEFKEAYKNLEKEQILAEVNTPKPEFVLPQKWCVKPKNNQEADIVFEFEGIREHNDSRSTYYYQHYPPFKSKCTASVDIQKGYTEITFEQFEKYVLNKTTKQMEEQVSIEKLKADKEYVVYIDSKEEWEQLNKLCGFKVTTVFCGRHVYSPAGKSYSSSSDRTKAGSYSYYDSRTTLPSKVIKLQQIKENMSKKIIVGYKLNKPEYAKAAVRIEGFQSTGYGNILDRLFTIKNHSDAIRKWYNEDVLDLWFEPVYGELYEVGDWIYYKYDDVNGIGGTFQRITSLANNRVDTTQTKYLTEVDSLQSGKQKAHIRKATAEEIKAITEKPSVSIRSYRSEIGKDSVSFGCQTYKKDFVLQLGDFLEKSGLKIDSQEEIMKVVKYFQSN